MTVGESFTLEELEADPYPIYKRLRDDEPVSFAPAVQLWLVTRWDDVEAVDLDPETFTAATDPSTLNRTLGTCMLGSEGPDHRRIRAISEPPFRPKAVERHTETLIPTIADGLISTFEDRGEVELVAEFARPMSVLTLRGVLGLDEIPVETISEWFMGFMVGLSNFEGDPAKEGIGQAATAAATDGIMPIIERLERNPDESAISWMLHQKSNGDGMTREEVLANVKLMMSGGLQEPQETVAITAWALLSHPEQLAGVRDDMALIRPAIEEAMRCYSPVGTSTRQTTRATTFRGVDLEEGALVAAVLSSANRDERRWTDPDRFDIHRKEGAHLAFSTGAHYCLGAWLGRATTRVALQMLLERLPGLRLDLDHEVVFSGWEFRGPQDVHLCWDV